MTSGALSLRCATYAETRTLGRSLAALARPGDVIIVEGPLGAGKTAFVSGIGEGLGVAEPVTSPTFTIVRHYLSGFVPLVHCDVYRLGSAGEFEDLDILETASEAVLVVEWGDMVAASLPTDRLRVFVSGQGDDPRTVTFGPAGSWLDRDLGLLV